MNENMASELMRFVGERLRQVAEDGARLLEMAERLDAAEAENRDLRASVEMHDRAKGQRWEKELAGMAADRGLVVEKPSDTKHDLVVAGKRVQCKRLDSSSVICSTPILGRPHRGYCRDDWDVLAARLPEGDLFIPVEALLLDDGVRVRNSITFEQWSSWRDRWDVFGEGFRVEAPKQRHLFGND